MIKYYLGVFFGRNDFKKLIFTIMKALSNIENEKDKRITKGYNVV